MATASVLYGRVGAFDAKRETFRSYVERMELFFQNNNIAEVSGESVDSAENQKVRDRQRAIFLTEIRPEAFTPLSNEQFVGSAGTQRHSFEHYNQLPGEAL